MNGADDTTPVLTVIGLWCDRAEPYWPDPKDYVDERWEEDERARVVQALRSGSDVRQFRGESTCRICGRLNGASELTDGTYLWPEGLAHYVRDHAVRLPESVEAHFLHHAAPATNAGPSVLGKATGVDLPEADESWWLSLGSADWG